MPSGREYATLFGIGALAVVMAVEPVGIDAALQAVGTDFYGPVAQAYREAVESRSDASGVLLEYSAIQASLVAAVAGGVTALVGRRTRSRD